MPATINALGLLMLIAATLSLAWRLRSKPIAAKALAISGLWTLVYFLVLIACGTHLCRLGNPERQAAIASICFLAVHAATGAGLSRWAPIGIALAGIILVFQASSAIHAGYPTNPAAHEIQDRAHMIVLITSLRTASTQPAGVHPGTVPRSILLDAFPSNRVTDAGLVLMPRLRSRWFTSLTGMYETIYEPREIIYDGGDLNAGNASDRFVMRAPANAG